MATLNPYLTFLGNCEEAFSYYRKVFGGDFTAINRFSEMPPQEGFTLSEEDKNLIMHISLPIGGDTVLMGSDAGGEWASKTIVGNNVSLSVNADTKEQADRMFSQLSMDGHIIMPLQNTFWGSYFGQCIDQFGISWMVSFDQTPVE
jgi:PhnB protein